MSQYDTQSPILSDARNGGTTNTREIAAFVLAEIIKFGGAYAITYLGLLSALYLWAFQLGSRPLVFMVSAVISAAWGVVLFVLFILFRAGLGGAPTMMGPQGGTPPPITRGAEIAAFALAYVIVLGIILLLNGVFLSQVYVAVGRSLAQLVALAIAIVGAVAVFALFIGFRQTMMSR